MLATLLVLGHLATPDLPRFTMTPDAGEALTAEVFDLRSSDIPAQIAVLLDSGAKPQNPGEVTVRLMNGLNMAYRDGTLPQGPIVLYAEPQTHWMPMSACRLTRDPQGVIDNSERAARWCLSFVADMAPVLILEPPALRPQPTPVP